MTKEYIAQNLLTKTGGLNNTRVSKIVETNEELYLIFNNLIIAPQCEFCNGNRKFYNFVKGYKQTCGSKPCANALSGAKSKEAKIKKYGYNYVNEDKANNTKIELYGTLSPHLAKSIETKKNTINSDGLNIFQTAAIKTSKTKSTIKWKETIGREQYKKLRKTRENTGDWTRVEDETDFKIYKLAVWRETNKQNIDLLENIEKRGHVNKEGSYHLDHQYSIKEGFNDGILPIVIGNISNLKMLPAIDNIRKGTKSIK